MLPYQVEAVLEVFRYVHVEGVIFFKNLALVTERKGTEKVLHIDFTELRKRGFGCATRFYTLGCQIVFDSGCCK